MEGGYNAWRLTALTPLPAWAIALAALAAVAAVLLALRGLRSEPRGARRAVLVLLRAVAALLALFLLVEPAIELLQTARVRSRFAILLDASRSMNFPVERDGEPRAAAAGAFLAEHRAGSRSCRAAWISSGTRSAPTWPRWIPPRRRGRPRRAGRTDLLGALDAVASGAGGSTRVAGALVVSDGADNAALADGAGPDARGPRSASVNAVAVGRSAPKDLAVERVAVDDFAFVRNTVTIEVTLRARGFSDEEVRLVLRREGAVVASRRSGSARPGPLRSRCRSRPTRPGRSSSPSPRRCSRARPSPRTTRDRSCCGSSATGSACSSSPAGRAGTSASCAGS